MYLAKFQLIFILMLCYSCHVLFLKIFNKIKHDAHYQKVKLLHQSIKIIKFNKIDSHFALLKEILHKLETPYHFIKDIAAIKRNRDIILSKLNTILNKYEKKYFQFGYFDSLWNYVYSKSNKNKDINKTKADENDSYIHPSLLGQPETKIDIKNENSDYVETSLLGQSDTKIDIKNGNLNYTDPSLCYQKEKLNYPIF